MVCEFQRLSKADFEDYQKIRIEALELQEREFLFFSQDEIKLSKDMVIGCLKSYFIIGAYECTSLVLVE